MTRKLKLTVAAVMTTVVTTMGVTSVTFATVGVADARDRSGCC